MGQAGRAPQADAAGLFADCRSSCSAGTSTAPCGRESRPADRADMLPDGLRDLRAADIPGHGSRSGSGRVCRVGCLGLAGGGRPAASCRTNTLKWIHLVALWSAVLRGPRTNSGRRPWGGSGVRDRWLCADGHGRGPQARTGHGRGWRGAVCGSTFAAELSVYFPASARCPAGFLGQAGREGRVRWWLGAAVRESVMLAADRVPSIRSQLHVGQPGAQCLRDCLAAGATRHRENLAA